MSDNIQTKFSILVSDLLGDRIHNLDSHILHAALGIGTESGEILTLVKKNMFYDTFFNQLELKEELSDMLHYIQMMCNSIDSSLDEIMEINIAKLTTRYPDGFNKSAATVRDKQAEKQVILTVIEKYHKGE